MCVCASILVNTLTHNARRKTWAIFGGQLQSHWLYWQLKDTLQYVLIPRVAVFHAPYTRYEPTKIEVKKCPGVFATNNTIVGPHTLIIGLKVALPVIYKTCRSWASKSSLVSAKAGWMHSPRSSSSLANLVLSPGADPAPGDETTWPGTLFRSAGHGCTGIASRTSIEVLVYIVLCIRIRRPRISGFPIWSQDCQCCWACANAVFAERAKKIVWSVMVSGKSWAKSYDWLHVHIRLEASKVVYTSTYLTDELRQSSRE